jgi:hypothetical protein
MLAWSLGIGPKRLPKLSKAIDPKVLIALVIKRARPEVLAACKPRSKRSIEDMRMSTEYAHWRVRDAQINRRKPPKTIDWRIVMLRHHVLNWLLSDDAWDDVTTDT